MLHLVNGLLFLAFSAASGRVDGAAVAARTVNGSLEEFRLQAVFVKDNPNNDIINTSAVYTLEVQAPVQNTKELLFPLPVTAIGRSWGTVFRQNVPGGDYISKTNGNSLVLNDTALQLAEGPSNMSQGWNFDSDGIFRLANNSTRPVWALCFPNGVNYPPSSPTGSIKVAGNGWDEVCEQIYIKRIPVLPPSPPVPESELFRLRVEFVKDDSAKDIFLSSEPYFLDVGSTSRGGYLSKLFARRGLDKPGSSSNATRFFKKGKDIRLLDESVEAYRLEVTDIDYTRLTVDRVEDPWVSVFNRAQFYTDWSFDHQDRLRLLNIPDPDWFFCGNPGTMRRVDLGFIFEQPDVEWAEERSYQCQRIIIKKEPLPSEDEPIYADIIVP